MVVQISPQRQHRRHVACSTSNRLLVGCFAVCLGVALFAQCNAEYFSSIDSIQVLRSAEKDMVTRFQEYLHTQAQEFAFFRKFLENVKTLHAKAVSEDLDNHLGNAINAYILIKRTVVEWKGLTTYIKDKPMRAALKTKVQELQATVVPPDGSELRGAAKGLGRLQMMYNLTSAHLADGRINNVDYGIELSTRDIFEIAANLFESKEYALAIEWFEVLFKLMDVKTYEKHMAELEKNEKGNPTKLKVKPLKKPTVGAKKEQPKTRDIPLDIEEYFPIGDPYDAIDIEEITNDIADKEIKRNGTQAESNDLDFDEFDLSQVLNEMEDQSYLDVATVDSETKTKSQAKNTEANNKITEEPDDKAADESIENTDYSGIYLNRFAVEDNVHYKMLIESLEYMALAYYELDQTEKAKAYVDDVLELEPESTLDDFQAYMNVSQAKKIVVWDTLSSLNQNQWFANYSRLCQGRQAPDETIKGLTCSLDSKRSPLFVLAPLKKEQLHRDPEVYVYYGLLTEGHIDKILDAADAGMHRSQVGNSSQSLVRDVRVSQQTWLAYDQPTTRYIYNLVSAISGFDLKNAETMQVANYGVGGQYDPHHDYFGLHYKSEFWIGDRLATHLFYLSEVEQGGYTVFPLINLYSRPVKGSMVMWPNLHKSVDPDQRTLHAGCPVIKGTKRISNVWVHAGFQEFRRPCDLVSDKYKSDGYSGKY